MIKGTTDEGLFPSNYVKKMPKTVKNLDQKKDGGPWETMLQLARTTYDFTPTKQVIDGFKGTAVLHLEAGDIIEVTDCTGDWWSGILQATHAANTTGQSKITTEFERLLSTNFLFPAQLRGLDC